MRKNTVAPPDWERVCAHAEPVRKSDAMGLHAVQASDRTIENWMIDHVGPAFDALKKDPTRTVAIENMRARLAAEHNKAR